MNDTTCFQTMCSEDITELAKAMLRVQQSLNPASNDRVNSFTNSKYATLNSVVKACRTPLAENGIWVTQYPVPVDGGCSTLGLMTKLVHTESGQWQSSLLVMPLPKNDPQGYGSALTYARRYGLSALVGIVTEDDDANYASNHNSTTPHSGQNQPKFQPQKPVKSGSFGQQNQQNGNDGKQPSKSVAHKEQTHLPKIDGVVFQQVKSAEGKEFVTATGKTHDKKAILKQAGFRWDPDQKLWWRGVAS